MQDPYKNHKWRPTKAPLASSRTDDIWFNDAMTGWAVNSNGNIIKTTDGGESWVQQAHFEDVRMRCIGFANENVGWVGTFDREQRLIHTANGGADWSVVEDLPGPDPVWICGLCVVNENVVYAAGTNDQKNRAAILKTTNGGDEWTVIDMDQHAASLIDITFKNENEGWVVGGNDTVKHPDRPGVRGDLVPAILKTTDGGQTWTNKTAGLEYLHERAGIFPQGEWCWKIQVIDDETIVVSNQNYRDGAMLRSDDGGETWERLRLNDRQRNSNLEGIGFLDSKRGWVGGWGDLRYSGGYSSATCDGGANWEETNDIGFRINRFRFIGSPPTVAYASGHTVYKFSDEPIAPMAKEDHARDVASTSFEDRDQVEVPIDISSGTKRLTVRIWDGFGEFVRLLTDEQQPTPGPRKLVWDFRNDAGGQAESGCFICRVTTDGVSVSFNVSRQPPQI